MNIYLPESKKLVEILHLSTGHEGGAGLAARRLNRELNRLGIKSYFAAIEKNNYIPSKNEFVIRRNAWQKLISALNVLIQKYFSRNILFSSLSSNIINSHIIQNISENRNLIIHIHNWYNLISISEMNNLINKGYRLVLTLHDQRTFTGGCHYAYNCHKFQSNCFPCKNLRFPFNFIPFFGLRILKKNRNFRNSAKFIAPSQWIRNEAKSSPLLFSSDIEFIPNVLDFDYSKNTNVVFNNSKSRTTFGIASMNPNAFLKGGDLVSKLIQKVVDGNKPFDFLFLNEFHEDKHYAEFWTKIDFLLVLSRMDNSPNVIHEAKSFGIPVIASSVGGISELISPPFDIVIDPINLNVEHIFSIITNIRKRDNSSKKLAKNNFESYTENSLRDLTNFYNNF